MNNLERIQKKFKNFSRFAALAGVPYYKLYDIAHSDDRNDSRYLRKLIDDTEDKALDGEVTPMLLSLIANALPEDVMQFCRDNGVQHYWLQQVLNGEVIFINKRVKRLMSLLEVEI